MIGCELFENQYSAWRENRLSSSESSEMQTHQLSCYNCKQFNSDLVSLRKQVQSSPVREVKIGFEHRLQKRIKSLETGVVVQSRNNTKPAFQGWGLLGAGLATGFVIGIIITFPMRSNNDIDFASEQSITNSIPQIVAQQPEINAEPVESTAQDSIDQQIDQNIHHFDSNRHSRVVSGER